MDPPFEMEVYLKVTNIAIVSSRQIAIRNLTVMNMNGI